MTTATHAADSSNTKPAPGERTVRFRIKRCEGPGKPTRYEEFDVPVTAGAGANVISCLLWIAQHPVTRDGKETTPVVWDSSCLEEVCGACTMLINGKVRQSCSCLIDDAAPNNGDTMTLEPMTKFPVVRDLWVDRSRMFHNLKRIQAWAPIDSLFALGAGPTETPDQQHERYEYSTCMTCGCCLEACPQFTLLENEDDWNVSFVGANTIGQARLFNAHPTGANLKGERLEVLMGPGGVSDCGNSQNCAAVCPKEIPLTEGIAVVGREATVHAIKQFFTGK